MAGPGLIVKKRMLFILGLFSFIVVCLLIRVGYLQLIKGSDLTLLATEQQNQGQNITPARGTILDRNGEVLAISGSVVTVAATPKNIGKSKVSPEMMAAKLAEFLKMDKETILKKITENSRYVYIKKKVEREVGDQIRQWIQDEGVAGIQIEEDTKRYYPNRNLASHVIGFSGIDNQGLMGIEAEMDKYLKGVPGKILSETDVVGRKLPFSEEKRIEAQDGLNVKLTLDMTIQFFAERALEKAIYDNKVVHGATAIVMNPNTGDILAMTSKPDFDLNDPMAAPEGVDPNTWNPNSKEASQLLDKTVRRNKAVQDTYEPGSTFKAITSSAALEEGLVTPDTVVNDFTVTVMGRKINCWKANAHGVETFRKGVQNSCNPVFVKLSQQLGIDRFYKYVRAFGFYEKTNIDLSGEALGIFHTKPTELNMATASFGQRFTITPIQLITAYAAIANGGQLMKPRLVTELTDAQGNIVKKFEPEVIREVISKKTSDTLKDILESVVSEGTGKNAYIQGYRVAGKSGTSETLKEGEYISSFSSFAPADNPSVCVLVVLDTPTAGQYYGGNIVAPVVGELMKDILEYLQVEKRYTDEEMETMLVDVDTPDVRNMTLSEAQKLLKNKKLEYRIEGNVNNKEAVVMEQTPKPYASVQEQSVVVLYTYKPENETMVKVPDLSSKTVEQAVEELKNLNLNIKINGTGNVIKQSIKPGTKVPKGQVIEVEFRHMVRD